MLTVIINPDTGIMTAAQFREMLPAFADSSVYLDDAADIYLQLASQSLDPNRWGQWLSLGTALFTAHFLSLDQREANVAAAGGVPGQAGLGILSSKSVGSVSAGYSVNLALEANAGHWGLTTFGLRYIRFARLAGSGGVQITGQYMDGKNNNIWDRHGPKIY